MTVALVVLVGAVVDAVTDIDRVQTVAGPVTAVEAWTRDVVWGNVLVLPVGTVLFSIVD